jgi:simple sugar transport system permease protein
MGGLCAAALALNIGFDGTFALVLALIAGMAGGATWAAIAGWMRGWLEVNEVISTLLLNFVAISVVSLMVQEPSLLREPITSTVSLPQSEFIAEATRIPKLFPSTSSPAHLGVVFALIAAVIVAVMIRRTVLGFRIRMLGSNRRMAERTGVRVPWLILGTMALSGAFGGLAGGGLVLGEQYRLKEQFSPGFGFDGIAVALVARDSPAGSILVAIFFGALRSGGALLEARVQIPQALVLVVQGTVIVAVAGLAHRRRSRGRRADQSAPSQPGVVEDDPSLGVVPASINTVEDTR